MLGFYYAGYYCPPVYSYYSFGGFYGPGFYVGFGYYCGPVGYYAPPVFGYYAPLGYVGGGYVGGGYVGGGYVGGGYRRRLLRRRDTAAVTPAATMRRSPERRRPPELPMPGLAEARAIRPEQLTPDKAVTLAPAITGIRAAGCRKGGYAGVGSSSPSAGAVAGQGGYAGIGGYGHSAGAGAASGGYAGVGSYGPSGGYASPAIAAPRQLWDRRGQHWRARRRRLQSHAGRGNGPLIRLPLRKPRALPALREVDTGASGLGDARSG